VKATVSELSDLVSISYLELCTIADQVSTSSPETRTSSSRMDKLLHKIHQAYASNDSLGILVITDMPSSYITLRSEVLPSAHKLATLPQPELDAVTLPQAGYQVGWSYGKEQLDRFRVDTSKGSFYFNPLSEDLLSDIQQRNGETQNVQEIAGWNNPGYVTSNRLPSTI